MRPSARTMPLNVAGLATYSVGLAPLAAAYSRAKLENSRLWVWTCWPGAIACFALPMIWS